MAQDCRKSEEWRTGLPSCLPWLHWADYYHNSHEFDDTSRVLQPCVIHQHHCHHSCNWLLQALAHSFASCGRSACMVGQSRWFSPGRQPRLGEQVCAPRRRRRSEPLERHRLPCPHLRCRRLLYCLPLCWLYDKIYLQDSCEAWHFVHTSEQLVLLAKWCCVELILLSSTQTDKWHWWYRSLNWRFRNIHFWHNFYSVFTIFSITVSFRSTIRDINFTNFS